MEKTAGKYLMFKANLKTEEPILFPEKQNFLVPIIFWVFFFLTYYDSFESKLPAFEIFFKKTVTVTFERTL